MLKKAALLLLLAALTNAIVLLVVWGYHAFVSGLNPFLAPVFTVLSLLILVPVTFYSIKWLSRQSRWLSPATAFLYGLFVILLEYLINLAANGPATFDKQLHDTFFVTAHGHLVLFFVLVFLAFATVYTLIPRITGKTMNPAMGYIHFALTLVVAYYLCCPPLSYSGLAGMPRRYFDYSNWVDLDDFSMVNHANTQAILLLALAQVVFLANLIWLLMRYSFTKRYR